MVFKSIFGKKDEKQKTVTVDLVAADKIHPPIPQEPSAPPVALHLENAMVENARNDTSETRARLYQELLFSDLLLALADPSSSPSGPGLASNANGTPAVNVALLSNPQGIQFAAAFTSALAARRWREEGGQYVSIRGQDIFKLLEPSPVDVIVVNPGSAPFIALNKIEYRQLAAGVVPQSQKSPVQIASESQENALKDQSGMKIAFPPDVFTEEQKQHASAVLSQDQHIEAAAVGAILPPNAPQDTGWLRTIFLRLHEVDNTPEAVQKMCADIRNAVRENVEMFAQVQFEVGIMPDPKFWEAMHQNNFILFDKKPSVETDPDRV